MSSSLRAAAARLCREMLPSVASGGVSQVNLRYSGNAHFTDVSCVFGSTTLAVDIPDLGAHLQRASCNNVMFRNTRPCTQLADGVRVIAPLSGNSLAMLDTVKGSVAISRSGPNASQHLASDRRSLDRLVLALGIT